MLKLCSFLASSKGISLEHKAHVSFLMDKHCVKVFIWCLYIW